MMPMEKRLASGVEHAHIAQLVEHALGKGEVNGSSPFVGSIQELAARSGEDSKPEPDNNGLRRRSRGGKN